jgi:hypothetical protein
MGKSQSVPGEASPADGKRETERRTVSMRLVERVGGYYSEEELPFGTCYRWQPCRITVECRCGKREQYARGELIERVQYCECGEGQTSRLRTQLIMEVVEEEAGDMFHPWRYHKTPEDAETIPI